MGDNLLRRDLQYNCSVYNYARQNFLMGSLWELQKLLMGAFKNSNF